MTLTTPDRSFHTFTSCLGESVLSLEPSTFASRISQAGGKSAAVSGSGHVLLDKAEPLRFWS